jgi:hypothetical protein
MPLESLRKSGIIEDLSKERVAKEIKAAKKVAQSQTNTEAQSKTNKDTVSFCDVMKTNTSEVIKKMQSQMLLRMELLSDLYMKYLHSLDDLYGTCYVSEKEFFDKLPIDKDILQTWQSYWNTWKELLFLQMDASAELEKGYVKVRMSTIDSYDEYMHLWMESYAKSLSELNSFMEKPDRQTKRF